MFSRARTGVTLPACHGPDKGFSPKLSHTLAPVSLKPIGVDPQPKPRVPGDLSSATHVGSPLRAEKPIALARWVTHWGKWSGPTFRQSRGSNPQPPDATWKPHPSPQKIRISNNVDYLWEEIVTEIQGPFPALRSLWFDSRAEMFTLPDSFLNGSGAPSLLQHLTFWAISFPSLPRLLLSTGDLTSLRLFNIPDSGYISPVAMATSLSALPKLELLLINFKSPTPHPQRRDRPVPPSTRFVLPTLTELRFQGVSEYFEVLAAQFDAPRLDHFKMKFHHQPELVFDIPQTIRFFGHIIWFRPSSLALKFDLFCNAFILFPSNTMPHSAGPRLWNIMCERLDWQVSSVAQICSQILHLRSSVESLNIGLGPLSGLSEWVLQDDIDSTLWSQLFHSFTSVHSLDIHAPLERFIGAALQGLTEESAAEVFPSLHSLSIVGKSSDETVHQGIQSFIAARQHSSHPVAICCREVD
ncbi:hypothetical protein BGW80DRAFT_1256461 [Lactifluus volemus]|nr:hypothetical protein BGW80DRAFT_1256461 [Lactifluus volemus]